ncbi:hypothetical protein RUM43_008720 [Polyplax serrata]|uniref:Uncharacterized protein n=1 Tax=Polyplax serrata TaxID=468196 RepID=A0AAN8P6A3_POLSC
MQINRKTLVESKGEKERCATSKLKELKAIESSIRKGVGFLDLDNLINVEEQPSLSLILQDSSCTFADLTLKCFVSTFYSLQHIII